jgi:hypothetical protein
MRESEYEMVSGRYEDEVQHTDTPLAVVCREMELALAQAEKQWEVLAKRLTPFLGKDEPHTEQAERLAAVARGSSPGVMELRHLLERLEEFTGRMRRVHGRLEL